MAAGRLARQAKACAGLTAAMATVAAFATGCSDTTREPAKPAARNFYALDAASQVRITTYDAMGDSIGQCAATYVAGDIVAAPLSAIRGAHSAKANTLTEPDKYPVYGYTAFDFRTDLVLLRIGKRRSEMAALSTVPTTPTDTLFAIDANFAGKIFKRPANNADVPAGAAVFDTQGRARQIVGANGRLITGADIDSLRKRQNSRHASVYDLRLQTGRAYTPYSQVAGFKVSTSMGDFFIKLYDDVPEYRDNFIRLVSDHYYDSLLVHRVLPSFLIQTGAADSKYAKADDVVGWQGPGYTLPNVERQKHFHKRGAVAASKLPRDRNPENKCDGGQFYVVSGRTFSNAELDKIAKEERITFGAAQRETYATVGGAPHLDGEFVVFGEVTKGMDVVDRISKVPLGGEKGDRPVKDIRVWSITLLKK